MTARQPATGISISFMGVGHLAASFALRARFRRIPLFYLLAAGVFVDILWGFTILTGIEHAHIGTATTFATPLVLDRVPYTHSLVAGLFWGALATLAWWSWRKDRAGAALLGMLVASHWVLDWVSHLPDIPVLPNGPLVGLGLWRSRPASIIVELGMLWIGLALYARGTKGRDRIGSIGVLAVGAVLTILCAGAYLGAPPASVLPIAIGNVALFVPLALIDWVDRHRELAA